MPTDFKDDHLESNFVMQKTVDTINQSIYRTNMVIHKSISISQKLKTLHMPSLHTYIIHKTYIYKGIHTYMHTYTKIL